MQRVVHPTCDCCGSKNPDYESSLLQVRLCYSCIQSAANWMIQHDVAHDNPIATELFDSVWPTTNPLEPGTMIVWHKSRFDPRASSYTIVRKSTQ